MGERLVRHAKWSCARGRSALASKIRTCEVIYFSATSNDAARIRGQRRPHHLAAATYQLSTTTTSTIPLQHNVHHCPEADEEVNFPRRTENHKSLPPGTACSRAQRGGFGLNTRYAFWGGEAGGFVVCGEEDSRGFGRSERRGSGVGGRLRLGVGGKGGLGVERRGCLSRWKRE